MMTLSLSSCAVLLTLLDFFALRLAWRQRQVPLLWGNPLAFSWAVALVRCMMLALSGYAVTRYGGCNVPPALQGSFLPVVSLLCFMLPSYTSLQCLLQPDGGASDLVYGWGRCDVFALNYLVAGAVTLLWHLPLLSGVRGSEKRPSASLGRLVSSLRPEALWYVAIAALIVISSAGEMAIPYYTGQVTDWIVSKKEAAAFEKALCIMALLTVASAITEFVCDCLYNTVTNRFYTGLQSSVFRNLLRQEMAFFSTNRTGDIASHISSDMDAMSKALSSEMNLLMWSIVRGLFLFAMMLWLSGPLALFVTVVLPIILLLPNVLGKFSQNLATQVQESYAKANEVAMETFQAISTVRSFANEVGAAQAYEKKLQETYRLNKVEAAAYAAALGIPELLRLALKVGIVSYGGYLVTRGRLSSGALVTFLLYEMQLSTVVQGLLFSFPHVQKAVGLSEKVFEYLDRTPQIKPSRTLAPPDLRGHVILQDVSFSYSSDGNPLVLKGVSLELRPGTVTALVGPSGSGKSTVVALLQRFYEPQQGRVLLDGRELSEYEHHFLHQKVALVSQNPVLFARSLWANIAYSLGEPSEEKVAQAALQVGAHHFLARMSHGYETNAGEMGGQISGGQRQGIALARALIRDPRVLILDDATSALDTESQQQVEKEIYEGAARGSRSVLLISHHPRSVERADLILVMEEGAICERGTPHELLERRGLYWQLRQKQQNGAEGGTSNGSRGD